MRVNDTEEELILEHYTSKYYDPAKAHEYYERTKKLKGRKTSGMSDEQKESWGYVKEQIITEKKQTSEANAAAIKAEVEALQEEATATRERITEKLRSWLERLSTEASSTKENITKTSQLEKEKIRKEKQNKLDAIPALPRSASPEQKRQRALKVAKITETAKEDIADVTEETKEQQTDISKTTSGKKETAKDLVRMERKAVTTKLKSAVSNIRAVAKEIRETLANTTEETLNQEYDKIMKEIAGKKKSSKRK